jgi:alkaline phosphatase
MYLNGVTSNYSDWTSWSGPDVLLGGGAEQWIAGSGSPGKKDYYEVFRQAGYQVVNDKDQLASADASQRTLGVFSQSNMAKVSIRRGRTSLSRVQRLTDCRLASQWIDREIFPQNLPNITKSPTGNGTAVNQPGLAEMTLKAIDVLHSRSGDKGFFLMSEAASIDKMFHAMDYDRALGELLELDDTVRQTIAHLEKIGELDETLIIVTADHAHGFDVFGSSDSKYMTAKDDDRVKRSAIGIYESSGHSEYQVAKGSRPDNESIVYGDREC